MFEGKQMHDWNLVSSQMSLLANVNAPKGKRFSPNDFNPMIDIKNTQEDDRHIVDAEGLREALKARGVVK